MEVLETRLEIEVDAGSREIIGVADGREKLYKLVWIGHTRNGGVDRKGNLTVLRC